jgi:GNAT superfamily N-acetyltransferase
MDVVVQRTEALDFRPTDLAELNDLRMRAADFFAEVGDLPPTLESLKADMEDLPEGYTSADEVFYRGYAGGRLVGYAEVLRGWPEADSWIIGILLVDASLRSSGIGHVIAEAVAQDARSLGVRALLVGVIATRERSLAFWRREGYEKEVKRRQLIIGDEQHEIVRLEKEL